MRVLIAPDKFKGSVSAAEAAAAMGRGVKSVSPQARLDLFPMADGGEGTVQALVAATGGEFRRRQVHGPLGAVVKARFGLIGGPRKIAVIEMAEASGLHLIPKHRRQPLRTSTYGTGELIRAAVELGCREIVVGIGGSATVDGGAGMAQALGVKFFDHRGREIKRRLGGGDLGGIARVDSTKLGSLVSRVRFLVASDVQNPLLGPHGAARVFAPQKGASPVMVEQLECNLRHYARLLGISQFRGGGAAGGLGAGLRKFLRARFVSGAEVVMRYGRFDEKLRRADLVITGEGKLDGQTLHGKAPMMVARRAKRFGLPVFALAGSVSVSSRTLRRNGIDVARAIKHRSMSLEYAVKHAARLLEKETAGLMIDQAKRLER